MDELSLLRLVPNRIALAKWAARQRQPREVSDLGFVWHGLLRAVFGASAPKPFVDRHIVGTNELLGYVGNCKPLTDIEPLAALAAGINSLRINSMPEAWRSGRVLSFEVRARPIVRSRQAGSIGPVELDAAITALRDDPSCSREQAYRDWLAREFERDDAAKLGTLRMASFARTRVARRTGPSSDRKWQTVEGPDVWMRGELQIADAFAFQRLISRGIGRHRSFGFGCLLVAPRGVLD